MRKLPQVHRVVLQLGLALTAGALAGYVAALVRPRPDADYASAYRAPQPDQVVLLRGAEPAVSAAPVMGPDSSA